jgi:hypothetical protein
MNSRTKCAALFAAGLALAMLAGSPARAAGHDQLEAVMERWDAYDRRDDACAVKHPHRVHPRDRAL